MKFESALGEMLARRGIQSEAVRNFFYLLTIPRSGD